MDCAHIVDTAIHDREYCASDTFCKSTLTCLAIHLCRRMSLTDCCWQPHAPGRLHVFIPATQSLLGGSITAQKPASHRARAVMRAGGCERPRAERPAGAVRHRLRGRGAGGAGHDQWRAAVLRQRRQRRALPRRRLPAYRRPGRQGLRGWGFLRCETSYSVSFICHGFLHAAKWPNAGLQSARATEAPTACFSSTAGECE